MHKTLISLSLLSAVFFATNSFAESDIKHHQKTTTYSTKNLNYSTSGSAEVIIHRPVSEVFNILTNVNLWPKINVGATQAIEPKNIRVQKGTTFKEFISSPIPGIKDWSNEWHVIEFEKDKKFVIATIEQFAQVPIHSKITYEFDRINANNTEFERTIEVTLDDKFIQGATKQEVEALYRFIGSQWEMANHLKKYVEDQSSN